MGKSSDLWCAACGVRVPLAGKPEHEADGTHAKNVEKMFKKQRVREAVAHQIRECPGPLVDGLVAGSLARECD